MGQVDDRHPAPAELTLEAVAVGQGGPETIQHIGQGASADGIVLRYTGVTGWSR